MDFVIRLGGGILSRIEGIGLKYAVFIELREDSASSVT